MASLWVLALVVFAGTVSVQASNRIVGGSPATTEDYPSIVQVDFNLFSWSQSCAGTLVTNKHVVTAAHCFSGFSFFGHQSRRIRVGATNRNVGGVIYALDLVVNHPSYGSGNTLDGDISVIRTANSIEFGPNVAAVPIIIQDGVLAENTPVVHAGWGAIRTGGPASNVLLDVLIYTVDTEECKRRYQQPPGQGVVTDNMICAGLIDVGGRDACQGDSGGPLYYGEILVGVVSWGYRCAEAYWPGVSTRVASYSRWIVDTAV